MVPSLPTPFSLLFPSLSSPLAPPLPLPPPPSLSPAIPLHSHGMRMGGAETSGQDDPRMAVSAFFGWRAPEHCPHLRTRSCLYTVGVRLERRPSRGSLPPCVPCAPAVDLRRQEHPVSTAHGAGHSSEFRRHIGVQRLQLHDGGGSNVVGRRCTSSHRQPVARSCTQPVRAHSPSMRSVYAQLLTRDALYRNNLLRRVCGAPTA